LNVLKAKTQIRLIIISPNRGRGPRKLAIELGRNKTLNLIRKARDRQS
jgi:hypothetical protein